MAIDRLVSVVFFFKNMLSDLIRFDLRNSIKLDFRAVTGHIQKGKMSRKKWSSRNKNHP